MLLLYTLWFHFSISLTPTKLYVHDISKDRVSKSYQVIKIMNNLKSEFIDKQFLHVSLKHHILFPNRWSNIIKVFSFNLTILTLWWSSIQSNKSYSHWFKYKSLSVRYNFKFKYCYSPPYQSISNLKVPKFLQSTTLPFTPNQNQNRVHKFTKYPLQNSQISIDQAPDLNSIFENTLVLWSWSNRLLVFAKGYLSLIEILLSYQKKKSIHYPKLFEESYQPLVQGRSHTHCVVILFCL